MKRSQFIYLGPPFQNPPIVYGDLDLRYTYRSVDWAERMDLEQITCTVTTDHYRSGKRIGDLHVILPSPRIHDIMWTYYCEFIVTEDVRSVFEDVVEKSGGHRCRIEAKARQLQSHRHRVGQVYLTRAALLFPVGLLTETVGVRQVIQVQPPVGFTDVLQPFVEDR